MVRLMTSLKKFSFVALVLVTVSACADVRTDQGFDARSVVDEAALTVNRMQQIESLKDIAKFMPEAKAVAIFPQLVKGGIVFGAEGGTGILVSRNPDGSWGYPAFYTVGAGSVGLQFGIQDTEMLMIVRTEKGLDAIINHQGKIGADAGATVGVFGDGFEAAATTNLNADIMAFANGRLGLFIGASVEGMGFVERRDLNQGYYGSAAGARDIVSGSHQNSHADMLRTILSKQAAQNAQLPSN